jgi:hypothetical protein
MTVFEPQITTRLSETLRIKIAFVDVRIQVPARFGSTRAAPL